MNQRRKDVEGKEKLLHQRSKWITLVINHENASNLVKSTDHRNRNPRYGKGGATRIDNEASRLVIQQRLYTWKPTADNNQNIIRNHIDNLLVNRRYENTVTSTRTYPGADISLDHSPLVCNFRLNLKRLIVKKQDDRYELESLKNKETRECALNDEFESIVPSDCQI